MQRGGIGWLATASCGVLFGCSLVTSPDDFVFEETDAAVEDAPRQDAGVDAPDLGPVDAGPDTATDAPDGGTPLPAIVEVVAARSHACALDAAGVVRCWGANEFGQLGDGTTSPRTTPTIVREASGDPLIAIDIAAGSSAFDDFADSESTTCAIRASDQRLLCWGGNIRRTVGTDTNRTVPNPVPLLVEAETAEDRAIFPSRMFANVDMDTQTACAVDTEGEVWCWGLGTSGTFGVDFPPGTRRAGRVPGVTNAASVAVGGSFVVALTRDGNVLTWGRGAEGQLGRGDTPATGTADAVALGIDIVEVGAGRRHACALRSDGALSCWGGSAQGQTGVDEVSVSTPRLVDVGNDLTAIAIGGDVTCVRHEDGQVGCLGGGAGGMLGTSTLDDTIVPVQPEAIPSGPLLHAGSHTMCASLGERIWCWGDDGFGATGGDEDLVRESPARTAVPDEATGLAMGRLFGCVDMPDERSRCFGANSSGQLGRGAAATPTGFPVQVSPSMPPIPAFQAVSAGNAFVCAREVAEIHRVMCWGSDTFGQLGTHPSNDPAIAARARISVGAQMFEGHTTGAEFACAIRHGGGVNGNVVCWGRNGPTGRLGRLGTDYGSDDDPSDLTPEAARVVRPGGPTLEGVVEIHAGRDFACGRHEDGALWCWGDNEFGQAGLGTIDPAHTATAANVTDVTAFATGGRHVCAVDEGALVCWGDNSHGQLGRAAGAPRPTPGPGNVLPDVVRLSAGPEHTCVMRAAGTVACWGSNTHGQLGRGDRVDDGGSAPVPGLPEVVGLARGASAQRTCALTIDGTYCWGYCPLGACGVEDVLIERTPREVLP